MSETLTTTRGPVPAPDANLGYLFRLAFQRFRTVLEEALEAFALTSQEYGILSLFESRSELSTSELARISQVTRQTMHTAVLGLERSGLLERRSKNRRVVLVGPTTRGRERLEAATERVRELERAALAGLTRDEQRAIRNWLAGVATMASAAAEEARNAGTVSR
jgi:DNA-binding MarR family transcriptional regulator